MNDLQRVRTWPSTPAVVGNLDMALNKSPHFVVHFWAEWNGYDLDMDRLLCRLRPQFDGRLHFYSCDIDLSENVGLAKSMGVGNLPFLGIVIDRKVQHGIVGLRPIGDLSSELEDRLSQSRRPSR